MVVGVLLLTLASCTATSVTPSETGPSYTCCEAADINRDYQPGDTMAIHWIVIPGKLSNDSPRPEVELNACLIGPYSTVSDLKEANGGRDRAAGCTLFAAPVHPSGQPGEQPVSFILIPATAAPGKYNLTTSVSGSDFSVSGASIIQVISKP
jgi:hypothetical protein